MASEVLMTISKDEVERARLMSELKYELDTQSKITYARNEGRAEGRAEGRTEGMQLGEKNIINLLKSGKPLEEIIKEYDSENKR